MIHNQNNRSMCQTLILMVVVMFVSCGQKDNTEINELKNKIAVLEQKVNQLQCENDSLRSRLTNVQSTKQGAISGDEQSFGSSTAPSYYYGEILTQNGNRIKVEQFGKQAGDEYSAYKVKGVYKDQNIEIGWNDLRRIWILRVLQYAGTAFFPDSMGIELKDGRYYVLRSGNFVPGGNIPYISTDEITGQRRLQRISVADVKLIAINGRLESLNYCLNCKKYFPDIYKYCDKCGAELKSQNVPE